MKQKQKVAKSRCYCFTYFPKDSDWQPHPLDPVISSRGWLKQRAQDSQVRYFIMGEEICPTTEKIHYQGYVAFNNAKTFKQCKNWFQLDSIHIESAKGNDLQNKEYCSKENTIIEVGKPIIQGKRSDISEAITILGAKASMSAVLERVHNYQAVKHAELYLKYKEPKRPIAPIEVIWIYGSSGKGKTKKVYDDNSGNDIFTPITHKWWEGYDGHEIVLIDDIRRDYCKFHELLKLLDIYPFRVETKGGSRQVQFKKIYITAPYSPTTMWEGRCDEDLLQLTRRITQTINIDEF